MQAIDSNTIVFSNVQNIERARVVVLLGEHEISPNYSADCEFIELVIKQLYQPGSRILTEDNSQKPSTEIRASHIPHLSKEKYTVAGWDNPAVCAEVEKMQPVKRAIKALSQHQLEGRLEKYKVLIDFVSRYGPPALTMQEAENPALCRGQFTQKKENLLTQSQNALINWVEHFTETSFEKRQNSLIERLFATLQQDGGRERVFVLAGPEHIHSSNPKLQASCEKLCRVLEQVPFMVLARSKSQQ